MSSVHYKFKATLEYKTLTFDGLHIGVDELKKAICDKENIRTESFDLLLTNAHTKREYAAGELVPRNSSVVVQRVPRENAQKLPKVQDTSTSGMVQRGITTTQQHQNSYINPDEFAKMSEEQKLAHIKQVSTEKYSTANYQKRPTRIMEGPPPPTYLCNRCAQPGHWYKNCPLVNTRKTTGIPMDELMETTQDDPNAMLHPSGRFVKPIMHHQARLQRKHEPFPGQPDDGSGSPYAFGGDEDILVPEQYKCNLCKGLLREAVLAACCGHSFCAECYQQKLLANPMDCCPGPECSQQISADSLIPNKSLRSAIQKYMNEIRNGVEPAQTNEQSIGVNKPNVLTDTQSLLHKLMPDLAYEQAKRELATAGRSPTTTITGTSSTRTIVSMAPTSIIAQVSSNSAAVPISAAPQPRIALPVFDPKKPPPPLITHPNPSQLGASFSPVSSIFPTPLPSITMATGTTTSALSADEMSKVWNNFLKRKDMESMAKKNAASTAPGTSSTVNATADRKLNGSNSKSHQKEPTSPSEKSLAWENFLKRDEKESMAKKAPTTEAPGTSSSFAMDVSSADRQLNGSNDKTAESDQKSQASKRKKSKSERRTRSSKHKKSSKKKEKRHQKKDKEKKERRHEKKERRHEKKERRHEKKEKRHEKGEKERKKSKEKKKKNGKKEEESNGKNEEL